MLLLDEPGLVLLVPGKIAPFLKPPLHLPLMLPEKALQHLLGHAELLPEEVVLLVRVVLPHMVELVFSGADSFPDLDKDWHRVVGVLRVELLAFFEHAVARQLLGGIHEFFSEPGPAESFVVFFFGRLLVRIATFRAAAFVLRCTAGASGRQVPGSFFLWLFFSGDPISLGFYFRDWQRFGNERLLCHL